MMDPPVPSATSRSTSTHLAPDGDDDTVITPTRGERMKHNDSLRVEKTIKFRFIPSNDNTDKVHPAILHAHWIDEVKKSFGEEVQFLDNRNRIVTKMDPLRVDPELHSQQFQQYFDRHTIQRSNNQRNKPDHRNTTSYIVHRIRTSVTLSNIKAESAVFKLMKDHNFYVNEHRWSETDWETTQLGFLYGIDPQFYDINQATNKVTKALKLSLPRTKVPKFKLVYCSPKIRKGNGRTVRTKAYAIETQRTDREELTKQLKLAYKDEGTFVQFKMRTNHPEAFERFIKAQTQMIATNYVIVINHIGPDAMHYLSERISAIPGVSSLIPGPSVNEDGKYKVLVHQKNYHRVRNHLKEVIPKWYNEFVEPDAKAAEGKYPGLPEVSPIMSDGDSQGDQTYMSISVNTAMSLGSNLSTDSPPNYVYPKEGNVPTDTSTIGGSQATSSINGRSWADTVQGSRTHSSVYHKSSEESVSQIEMKKDLASSREEVAKLKDRLTIIEKTRAQEQKSIEEKVKQQVENERRALEEQVKQQVAQVLQEQLSAFTQQMTEMFAQMVMLQQTNDNNSTKRSAVQMHGENIPEIAQGKQQEDSSIKRRDHKRTPVKSPYSTGREKDNTWHTPDYLEQIASQPAWPDTSTTYGGKTSRQMTLNDKGNSNIMSESEDEDIDTQGSGNESTPKSLAQLMEAEAQHQQNE
jgi:hypothetical protein